MSRPKEVHYFGRNDPMKTPEWYESHFDGARGFSAIGEGSTSYTHPDIIHECVRDIHRLLPNARLIYMVRNPLRRLESDWIMRRHEGWATGSINEEVAKQETLISHGRYWTNISVYREHFPDEQILVVFLEDFARDERKELGRCFAHIGVEPMLAPEAPAIALNQSKSLRQYGSLARWVRRSGVLAGAKILVPKPLFKVAKNVLTRPYRADVAWDPDVRNKVQSALADDSQRFLEYCGKRQDFWHDDEDRPGAYFPTGIATPRDGEPHFPLTYHSRSSH
jgi:hypothetical protein